LSWVGFFVREMTLFSDFGWGSLSDLVFWGSLSLFVCVLLVSSVKISWNYDNLRSICVNILLCCLGFWCGYGAGNCLFFQLIDFLCIFLLFSVFFRLRFKTMCEFGAFFLIILGSTALHIHLLLIVLTPYSHHVFLLNANIFMSVMYYKHIYWLYVYLIVNLPWLNNLYTGCISILLLTYPDWIIEAFKVM